MVLSPWQKRAFSASHGTAHSDPADSAEPVAPVLVVSGEDREHPSRQLIANAARTPMNGRTSGALFECEIIWRR